MCVVCGAVCGTMISSCSIYHVSVTVYVGMSCCVESGMSICQYGGYCDMSCGVEYMNIYTFVYEYLHVYCMYI